MQPLNSLLLLAGLIAHRSEQPVSPTPKRSFSVVTVMVAAWADASPMVRPIAIKPIINARQRVLVGVMVDPCHVLVADHLDFVAAIAVVVEGGALNRLQDDDLAIWKDLLDAVAGIEPARAQLGVQRYLQLHDRVACDVVMESIVAHLVELVHDAGRLWMLVAQSLALVVLTLLSLPKVLM